MNLRSISELPTGEQVVNDSGLLRTASWFPDELGMAGRENLDPAHVARYDGKVDAAAQAGKIGDEFASHGSVSHSIGEYVTEGGFVHTNTVESSFAIIKRGVFGNFHHISEAHHHRYLTEFDLRYNHRIALGVNETMRAAAILEGIGGKRLAYRRIGEGADA